MPTNNPPKAADGHAQLIAELTEILDASIPVIYGKERDTIKNCIAYIERQAAALLASRAPDTSRWVGTEETRQDVMNDFMMQPEHDLETLHRYANLYPWFAKDFIEYAHFAASPDRSDEPLTEHDEKRIDDAWKMVEAASRALGQAVAWINEDDLQHLMAGKYSSCKVYAHQTANRSIPLITKLSKKELVAAYCDTAVSDGLKEIKAKQDAAPTTSPGAGDGRVSDTAVFDEAIVRYPHAADAVTSLRYATARLAPASTDEQHAAEGEAALRQAICRRCGGDGAIDYEEMGGAGPNGSYSTETLTAACPDCNGTGAHIEQRAPREGFQSCVAKWMVECFGPVIPFDLAERSHRFTEEALELVQACGMPKADALALVDYVYGRPVGEPTQEVGGTTVTLAALCHAHRMDMQACAQAELDRITQPAIIEKIRAKQAAKPRGIALPIGPDVAQAGEGCSKCGATGLHACNGAPVSSWTEAEKLALNSAVQKIAQSEITGERHD